MTTTSTSSPSSAELEALHRSLDQVRHDLVGLRARYGDVVAVQRLVGDLDRFCLDATELEGLAPTTQSEPEGGSSRTEMAGVTVIDDRPFDPALWADCDDEGLGGYHR